MNGDRECVFSPCRRYRYTLWRKWITQSDFLNARDHLLDGVPVPESPYAVFIGLNPSTADERQDDPTIRRCIDFASRWQFGEFCMLNLFAWRDTKPERMKAVPEPIGPENDRWIEEIAKGAGIVVAAWGKHGSHLGRAAAVERLLLHAGVRLHELRRNGDGSPEHPLYIPATIEPVLRR